MRRLLWLLMYLEWSYKINGQGETTFDSQSGFQQTISTNESEQMAEPDTTRIINMTNDLFTSAGTISNSKSTASFEISPSALTPESYSENIINQTITKQQEEWNNVSCKEIKSNCANEPLQSTSTISLNISEQPIFVSTVHVEKIKNTDITTTVSEFQGEMVTTPVTVTETSSSIPSQETEHSTSLEQSDSTEDSMKYQNDLLDQHVTSNTPFESLKSSSISLSQEITITTETPQINTEQYSIVMPGETNTSFKTLNTSENVYNTMKNVTLSDFTTNHVTEKYTNHFKSNDSGNESENTTSKLLILTTTYNRNLSDNTQVTSQSSDYYSSIKLSSNQTLQPLVQTYSTANNFHPSINGSSKDETFVTQETPMSINQSTMKTVENEPSSITTLPTVIATHDIQQKAFLFKHVNNLTDTQRRNMTIDIIFISVVDIVEWFHSYDSVFRRKIASLLTKKNESQSFQSMSIVYIAPTPLRNEKYFCVNFMVRSILNENVYEYGETIVQKINQNLPELAQTLNLPIESVAVGYNDTGKCHKSNITIQEKNWSIIVVLGIILIIAIAMILGMCIQKTKSETHFHEPWEEDVQDWNGTIHQGTGRYRSTPQLPITVSTVRQLQSIEENLPKVNLKGISKEDSNPIVLNNGLENVLIHNEEKNHPDLSCGENNETYIEDTKL